VPSVPSRRNVPLNLHAAPRGPSTIRSRAVRAIAPVLLVLLSFATVFVHVPQHQELSLVDEWVYIDYLAKVPTEGVVAQGEQTGTYARTEIFCEGVRSVFGPDPAKCASAEDGTAPDAAFPNAGKNSADIYTPLYFVATWGMAQVVQFLGVDDLTEAARSTGAVWLALGMLFMFAAMRRLGVRREVGVGIAALLIASPTVYWSATYVTTDAPSIAVGASLLWLAVRIVQGSPGRVAFVVVAVVGVLLKVQNIVGLAVAALALLGWVVGQAWAERSSGPTRLHWVRRAVLSRETATAVGAVVAAVAAQGVWLAVRAAISIGPSADQGNGVPVSVRALLQESLKFLGGTDIDPTGGENVIAVVAAGVLVGWLSVAGVLGVLAVATKGSPEAWISRASIVMAVLAGPLLAASVIAVTGYYFKLPPRYGMVMLPAFLTCAGLLFSRRRWLGWVLTAVGIVLYLAALVTQTA